MHHLFGFRDNNRLALEAPEPMALAVMIALDVMDRRFALQQFVLQYDGCKRAPLVHLVYFHIPLCQASAHLFQSRLVTTPAFPVEQLTGLLIKGFPDPELVPLFRKPSGGKNVGWQHQARQPVSAGSLPDSEL
jgi:hypothetical protein